MRCSGQQVEKRRYAARVYRALMPALVLGCLAVRANAQNLTPGEKLRTGGGNDAAVFFAPFAWDDLTFPESGYFWHVDSASSTAGQRYTRFEATQTARPTTSVPAPCTVDNFYTIIHDSYEGGFLGTLLISTHGGQDSLAIEPYSTYAAVHSRYLAYLNGTTGIPGLPTFRSDELFEGQYSGAYAICVTGRFVRNHGRLGTAGDQKGALVYLASCNSGPLTSAFVDAGARVAIGNESFVSQRQDARQIEAFFKKMDGRPSQSDRPVSAARVRLPLTVSGAQNTTLSPSVTSVERPCPIKDGDFVRFHFDTTCDESTFPYIEGTNCTIVNAHWLNSTTLQGLCISPPPPGAFSYSLRLHWEGVASAQNASHLDGNTDPDGGANARGPSWDDYVEEVNCARTGCANFTREDEFCGAHIDDGCNGAPPGFFVLQLGEIVCGGTWADAGQRDLDWYQFNVSAPSTLTVRLDTPVVPLTCSVWNAGCPVSFPISGNNWVQPGNSLIYSVTVQPGQYFAYIAPSQPDGPILDGYPCFTEAPWQYYFSIDAVPAEPCQPANCSTALPEGEPCGTDLNGGCNSTPNVYFPIMPGQTVCGNTWANGLVRDTDWYRFTLEQPGTVRWTVENGEVPVTLYLLNADCSPGAYAAGWVGRCETGQISANLQVGAYYAFVSPGTPSSGLFQGYPCPGGMYRATLTYRPPITNDTCATALPVDGLAHVAGTTRGAEPDVQPPPCEPPSDSPGVWYWIDGTGHTLTVSLCGGTDFDAALSIYGGGCGALSCVAGGDDSPCGAAPQVSWCSELGVIYFMRIYGFGQEAGDFDLQISDDGTSCTPVLARGGCCLGQSCFVATEPECAAVGGVFQGDRSGCVVAGERLLCVAPVHGDLNCDGVVNNFDIDPFVLALTNPAGHHAAFPNCLIDNGDLNFDGAVNNFDIDPFVQCLTNGCP